METKRVIDEDVLCTVKHQADDMGKVLIGRNIVYRRVFPESRDAAMEFLKSELYSELAERKLFPATRVVSDDPETGEVVLGHDKATFILYASEWSFSMLKQAALAVIEVAQICQKHGYYLQDSHALNVVFFGSHPVFVDYGSFRKGQRHNALHIEEFMEHFYLPLALWADGNFYIANHVLSDDYRGVRLQPFGGIMRSQLVGKYLSTFRKKRDVKWCIKRVLNASFFKMRWPRKCLFNLSEYGFLGRCDCAALQKATMALMPPNDLTEWSEYHDGAITNREAEGRFERLLEIVGNYKWSTAIDVAGNGGYFTELMARRFKDARILCLDYDSQAVEKCYKRCCGDADLSLRITPGLVNIMYPIDRCISFERRTSADIVLALALTHHLLLRQGASLDVVIQELLRLSNRYLLIEFMPLGLWDGASAPPVPAWYTKEWFKHQLSAHCNVLLEEQVEANRICYMCEKRAV